MGQVIPIGCVTRLDLPVDTVLDAAREQLDSVVLCGYTKDGEEYFASTIADGGDVLWLLERCKTLLLKVVHDE
jgi:hypothetical protein